MSQQIRGWGGYLVFPISPENTNMVEDVQTLLPVTFCWIILRGFRGEVKNVSANQRLGSGHLRFQINPKNTNLVEDWKRSRKCLNQSETQVAILIFRSILKHKLCFVCRGHLDLAFIKLPWITFSCFRGEVEIISANQRPGQPLCFSNRPKKNTNTAVKVEGKVTRPWTLTGLERVSLVEYVCQIWNLYLLHCTFLYVSNVNIYIQGLSFCNRHSGRETRCS